MPSLFPNAPKPDGKTHIVIGDAINKDIRDVLEKQLRPATDEARDFAQHFKGATPYITAKNIWNYLRQHIIYDKDSEDNQDIRMPRRFHWDSKNPPYQSGDCKSFTLNSLALYKAIYPDLPVAFKYTGYSLGMFLGLNGVGGFSPTIDALLKEVPKTPSHVYGVVQDYKGNKIIIDGCYNFFNSEKEFSFALPLSWDMKVRILSDNTAALAIPQDFHTIYDQASPAVQKRIKQAMTAEVQLQQLQNQYDKGEIGAHEFMNGLHEIEACIGAAKKAHKAKKHTAGENALHWLDIATLAIGRGAYDALVALNFMGMADKLKILHDKYPTGWKRVAKIYYELGGYEKALIKAYTLGIKHRPFFLSKKSKDAFENKFGADSRQLGLKLPKGYAGFDEYDDHGVGFVAAATAATAAPVLAAILAGIGKAFHSAGATDQANDTAGQAQDLVAAAQPGQPLAPANIDIPVVGTMPAAPSGTPPVNEDATPNPDVPDPEAGLFSGMAGLGDVWGDIGGALGDLFHAGMKKLHDKLNNSSKTNPALKQLGNAAIDGASYIAGQGVKALGGAVEGYANKLQPQTEPTKHNPNAGAMMFGLSQQQLLLGGLVVGGLFYFANKGSK